MMSATGIANGTPRHKEFITIRIMQHLLRGIGALRETYMEGGGGRSLNGTWGATGGRSACAFNQICHLRRKCTCTLARFHMGHRSVIIRGWIRAEELILFRAKTKETMVDIDCLPVWRHHRPATSWGDASCGKIPVKAPYRSGAVTPTLKCWWRHEYVIHQWPASEQRSRNGHRSSVWSLGGAIHARKSGAKSAVKFRKWMRLIKMTKLWQQFSRRGKHETEKPLPWKEIKKCNLMQE